MNFLMSLYKPKQQVISNSDVANLMKQKKKDEEDAIIQKATEKREAVAKAVAKKRGSCKRTR